MNSRTKQDGFSAVEVLIVLVVAAVIGFAGYYAYHRQHNKTANTPAPTTTATTDSTQSSDVASAPTIKSTSDLDKALTILNQTDPASSNSADSSQLNSQLNQF